MKVISILVVCLAVFCGGAQAAKILALLENLAAKETHAMYFKRLTDAGLEVTYKVADDPSIVEDILEFIKDGGNVMMDGSSWDGGVITDHENLHVLDILTGCSFSSSHNPEDPITQYPHATGKNTLLITMDLFSDEKFSSLVEKASSGGHGVPSGNEDIDKALSAWCFQMAGVIRIDSVEHHLETRSQLQVIAICSFLFTMGLLCSILDTMKRARIFSLCWILIISSAASPLFWNFLRDTSDISLPTLIQLAGILISPGFLLQPVLILQRGPSVPLPIIIIGLLFVGIGHGAIVTALKAARVAALGPLLGFMFLVTVLGCVLLAAITSNTAIMILVFMEMVFILLVQMTSCNAC